MDPIVARNIARAVWYDHEHGIERPVRQPIRPRVAHVLRRWADALEHRRPTAVPGC